MKEIIEIYSIEIVITFFLLVIISIFTFIYTLIFFNIVKFKPKLFYPLDFLFYWKEIKKKTDNKKGAKKHLKIIFFLSMFFLVLFFYFISNVKTGSFNINH